MMLNRWPLQMIGLDSWTGNRDKVAKLWSDKQCKIADSASAPCRTVSAEISLIIIKYLFCVNYLMKSIIKDLDVGVGYV